MHKDPNLRKRNALVIPGGLLTLLSIIGMGYVVLLRGDQGTCEDPGLIVLGGACRSALLVLAIPLVIGLAMVGSGALAFRNKATCRHGWGSWAHFGLALLIGLVVVPLLGMLLSPSLVGEDAAIVRGGVDYPVTTVLAGVTGIGLIALVPFLGLYIGRGRANPCCNEKGCFDPCFCDEPAAASEDAIPPPPESGPLEDPVLATGAPPLEPFPEPAPEPVPLPPPEPAPAVAEEAWAEIPDEPAPTVQAEPEPAPPWEELPDEEPAAPEPEPAAEKPARKAAGAAPPLATRPTDPAAPPQDAMAIAAKWAEEDEEAERELLGSDKPARDYKPASNGKPAGKAKKATPKKKTLTKAPRPAKQAKPKAKARSKAKR